ncbi:MAG TPA: hypothetical protein VGJ37_06485 [Pyrinomonadaceae bacterium]
MIKILYGILAGLLSAFVTLILAYFIGVIVIAITTREFFATLLAAAAVWPLIMLFVLLIPTLAIGSLVGFVIGAVSGIAKKVSLQIYIGGAFSGLVFGVAVLSGLLPVVVVPQTGDFTSIISHPVLAGVYGLILGIIAARVLHKYGPSSN